jgi:tetratricopeptide (TPR) repeat protein
VPAVSGARAAERAALLLGVGSAAEALELVGPHVAGEDDPAPHTVAVAALLALGRPGEAARLADAALGAFGPVAPLFRVATHAHLAAGAPGRAREVARAGVQHAPQWVPGLLALVTAERAAGDLPAAEAVLARATALAPEQPDVRLLAAELAHARRDRRAARRHLLVALRLDPASTAAMRGLGRLDERRGRFGRAARWYAGALRLQPDDRELGDRVRALFGRFLTVATLAPLAVGFAAFLAFVDQADPPPGGSSSGPLFWVLCVGAFVGYAVAVAWHGLRGTPRLVLAVLAAESRTYRRARRCVRLGLAHALAVGATVAVALAPVGEPRDRMALVVLLWLLSMVLLCGQCVALRLAFGSGQTRPAR